MFRDVHVAAQELFTTVYVNNGVIPKLIPLHSLGYQNCILSVPEGKFVYFKEQLEALEQLLQLGRGIVVSPCASGKSLIIAGLCWNLYNKLPRAKFNSILLIVPTRQLVTQMYKDFVDYGLEKITQQFSSGETVLDQNKPIIISNRQWLQIHSDELPETSIVIVDECQQISSANAVTKYVNSLKTDYRFGFTATLPNDKYECYELKGVIGPVIAHYNYHDISNSKNVVSINLTSVIVKFNTVLPEIKQIYDVTEKEKFDNPRIKYDNEYEYFINSKNVIIPLLNFINTLDGNTLILFDYLKVRDIIQANYKVLPHLYQQHKVHFIDGSVAINDREDIRSDLETNNNLVVFAQAQTLGVGINIKNLQNVVLFFVSKSSVKVVQAIGRGARAAPGKTSVNIFDVSSNLKYSKKHFNERQKIYLKHFDCIITKEHVLCNQSI
jgi:superfamily II DNA or RNA helicase